MKYDGILPGWVLLLAFCVFNGYAGQDGQPVLRGSYLGQVAPGMTPVIFAPGIVSTEADEYAFEVSPDGDEVLFSRNGKLILITRNEDGTWNRPAVAPFSGHYIDGESCFSPDGNKIYFCSRRPAPRADSMRGVWISQKSNGRWGKAYYLDGLIHTRSIHAPTVAAGGNIYDDGIVLFKYVNGNYLPGRKIPGLQGGFPFIAPDESYMIFAMRKPGTRNSDLFISYHMPDGTWTAGISLGDTINSPALEGNSFVTADGKYLFFSRRFNIYWVSASIVDELRPKMVP